MPERMLLCDESIRTYFFVLHLFVIPARRATQPPKKYQRQMIYKVMPDSLIV